uniref:GST C-terminal domain-containing protein n=1 Tax=Heterorhabditis bacteriophora TaxID=37862 RepID=A0A1I7WEA7_HETBA
MTIVAEHSIGRVWQEEVERNEAAFPFLNGTDLTLQIPLRMTYTTRPSQDLFNRRIGVLAVTLEKAGMAIGGFAVVFIIIVVAFDASLYYLLWNQIEEKGTLTTTARHSNTEWVELIVSYDLFLRKHIDGRVVSQAVWMHSKATKQQNFVEQGPVKLRMLEQHLKQNGGKQFVGKKVTWCDLFALCILSLVEEQKADLFEDFPMLKKYYLRMRNLPEISDYIKKNWPSSTISN